MKPFYVTNQRAKLLVFALAFLATTAMGSYLAAYLWQDDDTTAENDRATDARFAHGIAGISRKFEQLSQLDNQYLSLIKSGNQKDADSMTSIIGEKEKVLRSAVDSLGRFYTMNKNINAAPATTNLLEGFKQALSTRRSMGRMRSFLILNNVTRPVPDDSTLTAVPQLLAAKDSQIASLEKELKISGGRRRIKQRHALTEGMQQDKD